MPIARRGSTRKAQGRRGGNGFPPPVRAATLLGVPNVPPIPDDATLADLTASLRSVDVVTYVMRVGGAQDAFVFVGGDLADVFGAPSPETGSLEERAQRVHPDDRERWLENARTSERTGVWDEEYRVITPEGEVRWIHDRADILPPTDGRPALWLGWCMNVTALRAAQGALASSELRHRSLLDHVPGVVYAIEHAADGRLLFVSAEAERQIGYPRAQWLEDPEMWLRIIHEDDRARVATEWAEAVRTGEPLRTDYRIVCADGRERWFVDRSNPVRDADGQILFWEGVSHDATDLHEAERALRRSEERYRSLVEHLPVIVYADLPDDGGSVYVSPNVEELLGYPAQAFIDDPSLWERCLHPDDRARVDRLWAAAWKRGERYEGEYRLVRADGDTVWVRDSAYATIDEDGRVVWQGVMLDVTQERRAQEERRDAEQRFRSLVEHLPAVVYVDRYEPDLRNVYISPSVLDMTGVAPTEFQAAPGTWERAIHPDDRGAVVSEILSHVEDETPYELEYRLVHTDGTVRWVRDSAHPVYERDGTLTGWQGVVFDVTESHEAARILGESEGRLRALIENIPAVVYEMGPDDDRRTIYVSERVEELLGYTRQEWLDQPDIWIELLHPDDREIELAAHDLQSETGEPWSREYRLIAADGAVVWVRDQATLVRGADGEPITWQGVLLDITPRKEAEEALRQANQELELRVLTSAVQLEEANELMGLEVGERQRVEQALGVVEERYRSLVEGTPAVVYVMQIPGLLDDQHLSYVSPQIERLLGFTAEEWRVGLWRERLHPHDADRVQASAARSERTGEPFQEEYRYLAKDGHVVWVLDRATITSRLPDGTPLTFQGVMLDITAQKEAELEARQAERRFRALTEQGPVVNIVYEIRYEPTTSYHLRFAGPNIADLFGPNAMASARDPASWLERVHPDDQPRMRGLFLQMLETGATVDLDFRALQDDGQVVWLNERLRCVERDADGRPTTIQGVLIDVTARREAEAKEASAMEQLRGAVLGMPAAVYTESVDERGNTRYLFVSPQIEEMTGIPPAQFVEEPSSFLTMVHPDDRDRVVRAIERAVASPAGVWEQEYRILHRDGSVRRRRGVARRATPPGEFPQIWHGLGFEVTEGLAVVVQDETAHSAASDHEATP
jgi:PAS domain S-box-containing protein